MRIVGGKWRGRVLTGPIEAGITSAIRPTSDRLRETIFNILTHAHGGILDNARVVDLFAGTAAMGLEALSRGAHFALLIDDAAEARALMRANVEALGCGGATRIFRRDATRLGDAPPGEKFSLAFIDPPYGKGLAERALVSLAEGGWMTPDAVCVVEEEAGAEIGVPAEFEVLDKRIYGRTQVMFARALQQ